MVILFDLFIKYPELEERLLKNLEFNIFCKTITSFIENRLSVIKTEIDEEEKEHPNDGLCTMIFLMNTDHKFMSHLGYSENLSIKMESVFSQDDIKFVLQQVSKINSMRNN